MIHRTDGGGHEALNLALLCNSCHLAHHRGVLAISGTADQLEVHRHAEPKEVASADAHVGAPAITNANVPSKLDEAVLRTEAKEGLVGLGWKPSIAQAAVAAASASLGAEATIEQLIYEALRRCPQPAS